MKKNIELTLTNLQNILSFPFKGINWKKKFLIGSLINFAHYIIPIFPGIIANGYIAQISKEMITEKTDPTLPEWENIGDLLIKGLRPTIVGAIYFSPSLVMMILGYVALIFGQIFISASTDMPNNSSINPAFFLIIAFAGIVLMSLGMFLFFIMALFVPAAIMHSIVHNSIRVGFRIKEWWPIFRNNILGYVTTLIIVLGIYYLMMIFIQIIYIITIILCFLLPILYGSILHYSYIILAICYADAYRTGLQNSKT